MLRAFAAVARSGSVSRAAEQMHLSQPAVSLQLKAMAEQTGLRLFARKAHGLELTLDGLALLPQVERVLSSLAELNQATQRLNNSLRGSLRIGTILDPEFIRLGSFLRHFAEAAPHVAVELRHGISGSVLDQVERGDLDVGFHLTSPSEVQGTASCSHVWQQPLLQFSYLVVGPRNWAAKIHGQDWRGLAGLPWLKTPPQSVHHRLLASVFGPGSMTGVEPARVAMVDQEASMIDLVKSGIGLSLMRDSIAMREQQAHGLVVADQAKLDCVLTFICLHSRREDSVVEASRSALARAWSL
ncbi:LysR family transcriptional regulator [Cupriavidus sp. PET2-C1]